MDLLDLLRRPEGKTLEFKRDLSSPPGVLRTLVAFANTSGGTLLVGVEDGTRNVRGVRQPLDEEERLANLISDGIVPRLVPEIELVPWSQRHVLAVEVYPSAVRPHHVKAEGAERGVYVRVGSSNRRADADLVAELRRFARGEAFDEQPMPDLKADALDLAAVSDAYRTVRAIKRADLETLRVVTAYQGRKVPTVGGAVLFARARERHFPDAWIQAGRFQGVDRSRSIDRAEIRSYPPIAVEEAIDFVRKHATLGTEIGAVRRVERWSVPPVAVREAVINAVAHADYTQRGAPIRLMLFDDRVEVESPGLLPFGLTVDDLRRGVSRLRNRVIGRVFHDLGLMEHWGSGIQRMGEACREAGLAAPLLEEIGTRFRVTFPLERVARMDLDPKDRAIIEALESGEGRPPSELARIIGLTTRATRTRLAHLVALGLVRSVGTGPRDPRRRYYRGS